MRPMQLRILTGFLSIAIFSTQMSFPGFAGWRNHNDVWNYVLEDGELVKDQLFMEEESQKYYYLDKDGKLISGWKELGRDGQKKGWYFFSTLHDGTYGEALKGWNWIDGYCYCFDEQGRMIVNGSTPDGFLVSANGRWMVQGKEVYVEKKGYPLTEQKIQPAAHAQTVRKSSGGGSGGSSVGGSSDAGSSGNSIGVSNGNSIGVSCESSVGESDGSSAGESGESSVGGGVDNSASGCSTVESDERNEPGDEEYRSNIDGSENTNVEYDTCEIENGIDEEESGSDEAEYENGEIESENTRDEKVNDNNKSGDSNNDCVNDITEGGEYKEIIEHNTEESGRNENQGHMEYDIEDNNGVLNNIRDDIQDHEENERNEVLEETESEAEQAEEKAAAHYVIQYRAKDDENTIILKDLSGDGLVGDELEVPFLESITIDGKKWQSVDTSPRTFQLKDVECNIFLLEYIQIGTLLEDNVDDSDNMEEPQAEDSFDELELLNNNVFLVASEQEARKVLVNLALSMTDETRKECCLIGIGYDASEMVTSDLAALYDLVDIEVEEGKHGFHNGQEYQVYRVSFSKTYDSNHCAHVWEDEATVTGSCTVRGSETVTCRKCKESVETLIPAPGHIDSNQDAMCDNCKTTLELKLGDEITASWKKDYRLSFRVIDMDYQGSGNLALMCETEITPDMYEGDSSVVSESEDGSDFEFSNKKTWLNSVFLENLSNRAALTDMDGTCVTLLSDEQYESYRSVSENRYLFPDGNCRMMPVIFLPYTAEKEGTAYGIWNNGDIVAKQIGNQTYLFRCVSENYKDQAGFDKNQAMFLCDSVIPADAGLDFDKEISVPQLCFPCHGTGVIQEEACESCQGSGTKDEMMMIQNTRFFGTSNNYRYSTIHEWLTYSVKDTGNLVKTNIGIRNEYAGATSNFTYEKIPANAFIRHDRTIPQVFYAKLFIPSLEEALAVRDDLWKFHHSDEQNPETVVTDTCTSYWLRTPVHGASDQVYTVNLVTGAIEPKCVKATMENQNSDTGIRPMFVMNQGW